MNAPALAPNTLTGTATAPNAKPSACSTPPRTLDDFATEINRTYGDYIHGIRNTAYSAKALGDLLKGAQKQCKVDGIKWKPWVEKNCKCSYRSVARYMSIADKWQADWEPGLKDATVAPPDFPFTIRKIEALGTKPKTEAQLAAEAKRKADKAAAKSTSAKGNATGADYNPVQGALNATNDPMEAAPIHRTKLVSALKDIAYTDKAKAMSEVKKLIDQLRTLGLIT
jgi:hypothetical protein